PCITAGLPTEPWMCCSPTQCAGSGGMFENACCDNASQCEGSQVQNIRHCDSQTATYYFKVYRLTGTAAANCAATEYQIEISNGKY
ncbi:MAG TPA: hypothetical protein PK313_12000, partial [Myxococcota bacterium]|nr:hypothetical protein [Myxococcota bacterium]